MKFSNALLAVASFIGGSTVPSVLALSDAGDLPISGSYISVAILNPSESDTDFTPEEQHFIEMSLVKAFHKSHGKTEVLDLAGAKFEGQTHKPAGSAVESGDLDSTRVQWEWDFARFFPMWKCRNGWCPEIESFVSGAELTNLDGVEDVAVDKKKSPHAAWEKKLCKQLTSSGYPVFEHVEKCTITFESAPSVALTTTEDDNKTPIVAAATGDLPISDSYISVAIMNPSESDADFTPEEQHFIEMSLVKAFHKSHGKPEVLDLAGAKFEGQTHKPALAGNLRSTSTRVQWEWDFARFFPMWKCRNGWCPEIESFVSGAELATLDDVEDVAANKKKKSPHAAWEKKLCKELTSSDYDVFNHVKKCEITFVAADTTVEVN